ncbi:radical SAM family heme chaperone HemW [Thiocapsa bogorovii]|uniref:radical SAM family heme chaperone HemW n=1 Tax=Thiocapsa bogorovii TaxID=521689 RepID=UPI001E29C93F|nr:radical SAM family heme chaperone HemW [Thiocapsa bogorovii]UHD14232.1 radical SAM family heme chaperone HemW [Thiocapsa bogorovii]
MTESASSGGAQALPLALYVHAPWCVSKCPYCDFNSHAADAPPFEPYVTRLLADLDLELDRPGARRPLASVFIGGGTPSLFPGPAVRRLLDGIRERADLVPGIEMTLEANPGTRDAARFAHYREAGINRLSIGVQSLSAPRLRALGRIHGPDEVYDTLRMARAAGFDNLNLDMMFALPEQNLAEAREDLEGLIALEPEHISYYQLTLEPNTAFYARPPRVPDPDLAADMAEQGLEALALAGYRQYEVSAHARDGARCRHNLNYWEFGDYLGIGAGAHGKLTREDAARDGRQVSRTAKRRHPAAYLETSLETLLSSTRILCEQDLVFEFALNALRLTEGFPRDLLTRTTGLPWSRVSQIVLGAEGDGMLRILSERVEPTDRGRRFLDDLVGRFATG